MTYRYGYLPGETIRALELIVRITEAEGWDWRSAKKEIGRIAQGSIPCNQTEDLVALREVLHKADKREAA